MNRAGPFSREFWITDDPDDIEYTPTVVPFPSAHARANAAQAAMSLETDREEGKRLWDAYLAAIRRSVDAQADVNAAHDAWMNYTHPRR